MPRTCCIKRLTHAIPIQQQNPINIGLPPVLTSFTMFVLRPIADIAITIKNLLNVLKISKKLLSTLKNDVATVVTIEAAMNQSIKNGKIFFILTELPLFFSFLVLTKASTRVIGMMASVLVSLTIVALLSTFVAPVMPSYAEAAAVTEDVSFTAVPAKRAKPSLLKPRIVPIVGKIRAAITLNKNITEIA